VRQADSFRESANALRASDRSQCGDSVPLIDQHHITVPPKFAASGGKEVRRARGRDAGSLRQFEQWAFFGRLFQLTYS